MFGVNSDAYVESDAIILIGGLADFDKIFNMTIPAGIDPKFLIYNTKISILHRALRHMHTQAPTPEGESTYSESTSGDAAALPRPRKIRSGGDPAGESKQSESPSGGAALSPSKSNSPVPHPRRSDTGESKHGDHEEMVRIEVALSKCRKALESARKINQSCRTIRRSPTLLSDEDIKRVKMMIGLAVEKIDY